MINAKIIKNYAAEEIKRKLGSKWFEKNKDRMVVASCENKTEFVIEVDIDPVYRHEIYLCDMRITYKWDKFRKKFKEFLIWYNQTYPQSHGDAKIPRIDFLYSHARNILQCPNGRRDYFFVNDEKSLDLFIDQCVDDLNGEVGTWIRGWFTWPSAVEMMDKDQQLCGTWRESAYFWLVFQAYGPREANAYIERAMQKSRPHLQTRQLEYLKAEIARGAIDA